MEGQYTEYSTVPQGVRDVVANKCHLLDQYILYQTDQNEYSALIRNPVLKETTRLIFTRANNYGAYSVMEIPADWAYSVTNEYYVYSNIGYGAALDLPVVEGLQAHAGAVIVSVLMLAILFKGALFKCLRKSKGSW